MTISKYTFEEALHRILKTLEGKAFTADTPESIPEEHLPKETSLSYLSELLDNSLDGETLTIPTAVINSVNSNLPAATTAVAGIAQLADVDEANAGASQNTILTPEGHTWAHEYGGIYATGTTSMSLTGGTWTKVTGTFQGSMTNSGLEVTGDWNDDRIEINEVGSYFCPFHFDFFCHGTATVAELELYMDAARAGSSYIRQTVAASGTITSLDGFGFLSATGTGQYITAKLKLSDSNDITFKSAKIGAIKLVG